MYCTGQASLPLALKFQEAQRSGQRKLYGPVWLGCDPEVTFGPDHARHLRVQQRKFQNVALCPTAADANNILYDWCQDLNYL